MLIYKIVNTVNGKLYIGKSRDSLQSRWNRHIRDAMKGGGFYLHRAIRKYGVYVFKQEVLEDNIESHSLLSEREKYFIKLLGSHLPGVGYNQTLGGDGVPLTGKAKEAWIKNPSRPMAGKHHTAEAKKKMSEKAMGRKPSAETRKKLSESHKAENLSNETRRKLSNSHRKENLSEETRKKLSECRKGIKNPVYGKPPFLGRQHSEATKMKQSKAHMGVTFSKEHIDNLKESQKRRRLREKIVETSP